jgi:hypothetical protein
MEELTMENIKNEVMNEAMENVIEDVVVDGVVAKANMHPALKGGLAVAAVAAIALLVKKGYDAHKEKTALRQPDKEIIVEPEDVMEVAEAK